MLINSKLVAKKFLNVVVVVQTTGLKLRAQRGVNPGCHLVLDFMPNSNQKPKIVRRISIYRTILVIQTTFEFPVFIGTSLGIVEATPFAFLFKITVLDFLFPIVGVQKICPGN